MNFPDFLSCCKRGPQIIIPKDIGTILAETGVSNGWKCLDAGGGSGFTAMFLANAVKPDGVVYCYEKSKNHYKLIKKNLEISGLKKYVVLKNKDVINLEEKDLDLAVLDMKGAEDVLPKISTCLKQNGWLIVYSPHIEQQKAVIENANRLMHLKTIETIQREWKINNYTHPKPKGITHTGFLTFFRKF